MGKDVQVRAIATDVADPDSVQKAFGVIGKGKDIDVYINNAGFVSDIAPVSESNAVDWWKAMEVNMCGSLLMAQNTTEVASSDAVMINVTSVAHVPFVPGHSAYAVSKIGSTKLFEYLQHENPGLRIFNLQPGIIEATGVASKAAAQSGISWPQQDTRMLPSLSHCSR